MISGPGRGEGQVQVVGNHNAHDDPVRAPRGPNDAGKEPHAGAIKTEQKRANL